MSLTFFQEDVHFLKSQTLLFHIFIDHFCDIEQHEVHMTV